MEQKYHPLQYSLVRILASDNFDIIGVGYLITENLVCSCAHVISAALGRHENEVVEPGTIINLDFPLFNHLKVQGKVTYWARWKTNQSDDIALISLQAPLPSGANPANLLGDNNLAGHSFTAFGYPGIYFEGVWVDQGIIGNRLPNGCVQIRVSDGFPIKKGFSGGAVWDIAGNGVVGMVVASASRTDADSKIAVFIPNDLIFNTLPHLKSLVQTQSIVPESPKTTTNPANIIFPASNFDEPVKTIQGKRRRIKEILEQISQLKLELKITTPARVIEIEAQIKTHQKHLNRLKLEVRNDLRVKLTNLDDQPSVATFVGRKNKLNELDTILDNKKGTPIISIEGLGGSGKTALAYQYANLALQDNKFEATVWESDKRSDFDGNTTHSLFPNEIKLEQLLNNLGDKLGYYEVSNARLLDKKIKLVQEILHSERYLVVIDNLETVKDYQSLVENLRKYKLFGNSRCILTSRQRVEVPDSVYSVNLGGMELDESIEFLRTIAKDKGYQGGQIINASDHTLEQIYRATGGLPLAMKLMVGKANNSSINTIIKNLQQVNYRQVMYEAEETVYQRFFKFIYADTWQKLSPNSQTILQILSSYNVIEGAQRADLEMDDEFTSTQLEAAITELDEYCLLTRHFQNDQEYLFIHPLTQRFARNDAT